MHMRIDVKPRRVPIVREIATWTGGVFRSHHIGAHTKCVIDATDSKWKRAAAMRKSDTKAREPFEHAAKNHGTNRERRLCWHANQPWQPIFRHTLAAQHVPRMNKNCGVDFFSSAPDRLQRCVVEVQRINASEMRICIHVRSDLRAAQPEFPDAALEFACGKIGVLHRNSGQACETCWVIANDFGNVIV